MNDRELKLVSLDKLGVPKENLRKHNTDMELDDLATNILALGQSQPLLVYVSPDDPDSYEVIDGQRRLNAFDMLNRNSSITEFQIKLIFSSTPCA